MFSDLMSRARRLRVVVQLFFFASVAAGVTYASTARDTALSISASTNEVKVNTFTTGNQDFPSVAMAANGDFVVAWQDDTTEGAANGVGIYARRYTSDGTPRDAAEFHVNSVILASQKFPSVATDANGNF